MGKIAIPNGAGAKSSGKRSPHHGSAHTGGKGPASAETPEEIAGAGAKRAGQAANLQAYIAATCTLLLRRTWPWHCRCQVSPSTQPFFLAH